MAIRHLQENKTMYALLAVLTGVGGTAAITDNLPVRQKEFQTHLDSYEVSAMTLENIGKSVDALVLAQLRSSLLQAYKDKCVATDPQAIAYINREIETLQAQHVALTGRRFEPPPCGVAP